MLRRTGPVFEIISNGVFLMDSSDGRSERLLVSAALAACPEPAPRILIGGLGVGFSLAEAVSRPGVAHVDVVEISAEIIGWHATYLRHLAAAAWEDDRVAVINADLVAWLDRPRGPYNIVCLDIDNGPEWTVSEANRVLYEDGGLRRILRSLVPDGVLAVWSASEAPEFERLLRRCLGEVRVHRVGVTRGQPDVIYVGRLMRSHRGAPSPCPGTGAHKELGG